MNDKSETVLPKTPLFANFTDTEMSTLAGRVSNRRFECGVLLFSEGDSSAGLFLVASGKIRIFKLSPAGRPPSLTCRLVNAHQGPLPPTAKQDRVFWVIRP